MHLPYLKADFVLGLLGIALDCIGCRHSRGVDVTVIGHYQTVAAVVHLSHVSLVIARFKKII